MQTIGNLLDEEIETILLAPVSQEMAKAALREVLRLRWEIKEVVAPDLARGDRARSLLHKVDFDVRDIVASSGD
jgi:hypothetical protein